MNHKIKILLLATSLLTAACSSNPDTLDQVEQPVETLYNAALNEALAGNTKAAAPKFEEVERQHPYSQLAIRAQIMAAWSFYQSNNYVRAISSLDRFVELNPADEMVDYAYYLKALSYYEQIVDVERDAEMTQLALYAFEELIRRFPNSVYARDGQLKIDLAKSHLAGKQMAVGRFYLKTRHYNAAIKRFNKVVKDYDTSNQVPEALYRLGETYLSLGLDDQSERALELAAYNYPDSIWTKRLSAIIVNPQKLVRKSIFKNSINTITNIFN